MIKISRMLSNTHALSIDFTLGSILGSDWSPAIFANNYRNNDNFMSTDLMVLDVDDGPSIAEAKALFKDYKHIIATTRSHQLDKHGLVCDRYRVILFLESTITDKDTFTATWYSLFNQFKFIDQACKDPGRFYYGSVQIIQNQELGKLISPIQFMKATTKTPVIVNNAVKGKLAKRTYEFLAEGAPEGQWNLLLFKAAKDMQQNNYTLEETMSKFENMNNPYYGGTLDKKDKQTIKSAFSKEPRHAARGAEERENRFQTFLVELTEYFKDKLLIYEDDSGNITLLRRLSPTIVGKISAASCISMVLNKAHAGGLTILQDMATKLFNTWVSTTLDTDLRIKEMPSSFSLDERELTFHYVDLELMDGPTPTWDDFIQRCGPNGRALMAFTWSIFENKCRSPQYLFLRGQGNDGKGSYTEWLEEVLGKVASASLNAKNSHWPSMCVGKRLGLWPELNNTSFVMSTEFKAITGGDTVTVTEKYEKAYTAKLSTKFILSTNQEIEVSGKNSEKRRMILVDIEKPTTLIPGYKVRIKEESSAFLYKCKQAYEELYDTEMLSIKADYSAFEIHSSSFEDDFAVVWEKAFKYVKGVKSRSTLVTEAINLCSRYPDKRFRTDMCSWMEREKGIKKYRSNGVTYYLNLEVIAKNALTIVKDEEAI